MSGAVQSLWNGNLDLVDFITAMEQNMQVAYNAAFVEGAKICNIKPDEFTDREREAIEDKIDAHAVQLPEFGRWIIENNKTTDTKLRQLSPRSQLWIERYSEIYELGKAMACANEKLEWVYDPSKENCDSCASLHGKVKRASYWYDRGILPRVAGADYLDCHGYNCGCELVPTDKPLSKGRLPSLP